jgi:hydroxymethylglutaryl-CoA lyase
MSKNILVTDVFLRDGLQDEPAIVSVQDRLKIAYRLQAAGVSRMEVASFVSPKRVPQMAGAEDIVSHLTAAPAFTATITSLALNARGVDRALEAGQHTVQLVLSASEEHSKANAGQTVDEALEGLIGAISKYPDVDLFTGISTAFRCPFEGYIPVERLLRIVERLLEAGITTIGLADTLGTTEPDVLVESLDTVMNEFPEAQYSLHLHNAHGRALESVDLAIERGVVMFDAALGGFGGCPFAPGAAGNLSTGELVAHLHRQGHSTGIVERQLKQLTLDAKRMVQASEPLPS